MAGAAAGCWAEMPPFRSARRFAPQTETPLRAIGARRRVPVCRFFLVKGGNPLSHFLPKPRTANGVRCHCLAACGKSHAAFPSYETCGPAVAVPHASCSRGLRGACAPLRKRTGRCIPSEPGRFAALCVAFRSKERCYSSLTRLVSRAPRRSRCSRHFLHRLLMAVVGGTLSIVEGHGRFEPPCVEPDCASPCIPRECDGT